MTEVRPSKIKPPLKAPGLLAQGNVDLFAQPAVKNPDGSTSTVRSFSANIDGKEVLLPTVTPDGRSLDQKSAIAEYEKTGRHLGIFDTPDNATAYAEGLHKDYEEGVFNRPQKTKLFRHFDEPDPRLARFSREANRIIDEYEGGYWNDPLGGETKYGISKRWHPEAWVDGAPSRKTALNVYQSDYWNPVRGDELPDSVAPVVFDFAIHSGPSDAIRALQKTVGAKSTGKMDDDTLRRVHESDPSKVIEGVMRLRVSHVADTIRKNPELKKNFERRFEDLRAYALGIASGGSFTSSGSLFRTRQYPDPEAQARLEAYDMDWQRSSERAEEILNGLDSMLDDL